MSETAAAGTEATSHDDTTDQTGTDQTTDASTDGTDWAAEARKWEKRSKANKTALDQLQARVAELEPKGNQADQATAQLTAAQQRIAELETRYKGSLAQTAISQAAIAAKTIDPETVTALVLQAGTVEVDDDGTVSGAKQAVAALVRAKPHLFRTTPEGTADAAAQGLPVSLANDPLAAGLFAAVGGQR